MLALLLVVLAVTSLTTEGLGALKEIDVELVSEQTEQTLRSERGCIWWDYACDIYYYAYIPSDEDGDPFAMRFGPINNPEACTLVNIEMTLYSDFEEFSDISGMGIDVMIWNDDGFGFPGDLVHTVNVPSAEIVYYPGSMFLDVESAGLIFNDDFHIGYTTVDQVNDCYGILADDGSCGDLRSPHYYTGTWETMLDHYGADINFLIAAEVCYVAPPLPDTCCEIDPDSGLGFEPCESINPVQELVWPDPGAPPTVLLDHEQVLMTPIVADLENDGIPEIFFISYRDDGTGMSPANSSGVLRVISGQDGGSPVFSYPTTVTYPPSLDVFYAHSQLAVADIDNDGLMEIIGTRRGAPIGGDYATLGQGLFRIDVLDFNNDGIYDPNDPDEVWIEWTSTQPSQGIRFSGISIADINKDGTPEIIVGNVVLNSVDGQLFTGVPGAFWGENRSWADQDAGFKQMYLSFAADVVADDDYLEVVNGRTVYNADGSVLWSLVDDIDSGWAGVGNFDLDDDGEVIVVAGGKVHLVDYTGIPPDFANILWTTVLPGETRGGPPCIGECWPASPYPEIGVAGGDKYFVLKGSDGGILCSFATQDGSSRITSSTMFDLNDDGATELIYSDECYLRIYHADDQGGSTLYTTPNSSRTGVEGISVADCNADGHAEIIVCANNEVGASCVTNCGIRVFGDAQNCWVNTRKIWNQHAYSITNVNDDGKIPQNRLTNWLSTSPAFNNFRKQMYWHEDPTLQPDLCVHLLRPQDYPDCDGYGNAIFTATVVNNGPVPVDPPVEVAFYHCPGGTPPDNCDPGDLLGTAFTTTTLGMGQTEDVEFIETQHCLDWMLVEACVDDNGFGVGTIPEYDETNNCCCEWLRADCRSSISGWKFEDLNLDGIKNYPDPGLFDWFIDLRMYNPNTGEILCLEPRHTDASGAYSFTCLKPLPYPWVYRVYEVTESPWDPTQWFQTTPNAGYHELDLQESQYVKYVNFGNAHRDSVHCTYDIVAYLPTVTFCANKFIKETSFTVNKPPVACNDYRWYLVPEPVGGWCYSDGLQFAPAGGTLDFSGGSPITVQFDIDRNSLVPPLPIGQYACYKLVVVDQCNGVDVYCAYGKITRSDEWCGKWVDDTKASPSDIGAMITNTGSETMFHYEFTALLADGSPDPYVSLNGLPPGTGVEDSLEIAPGDSAVISVGVEFTEPKSGELHQLMLGWDLDDDGDVEDAMSRLLMSWTCGDADASGGVDIDDVVYLIYYIFAGGPAPNPIEAGDANCSGDVDIDDVVYLINYIFAGGPAPCDEC